MSDATAPSPEDWAAAWGLMDAVLALPAQERAAWLTAVAQREPLRATLVRRLLAAMDEAQLSDTGTERDGSGNELGRSAAARLFASALGTPVVSLSAGSMVGDYRLVRLLGEGGMAQVWLAEQTVDVIRLVAVKIPHAGLEPDAAAGGRFTRERDLLAGLEHERIARLYDAGITADGTAFLAMEWIDGVPLTRYCDERQLGVDARLALFNQVLEAVGFAHSRLVIHRDLKPSNILVNANGQVKLLDFGVANLLSDVNSAQASVALDAMTPDSASPEQLASQPLGTSSDVYSLGIVLYELLSGRKPYALSRSSLSLHATLMATTIIPLESAVTAAAALIRATSASKLSRRLRGEPGSIVVRCLAKSPAERYTDVGALAADLDRLAKHEPVNAHGSSWPYRVRCLARRHRWPLLAGCTLLLVLAAGIVATQWQARVAFSQAQRAEAIQRFLWSLFRSSTPNVSEGHELTAKELLARGSERVDADLSEQPRALAELHSELGDILGEMGDDQAALLQLQRSVAGFEALGLADSRPALEALFRRGTIYMDLDQWQLARDDLQAVLARGLAHYGPRHRWAVGAREKLAFISLENNAPQESLAIAQEGLAQPPGEDPANDALRRLRVKVLLGEAQTDLGEYADARRTLTEAVAESNGAAGYGVSDRLVYRLLLARAIYYSGDFATAEPAAALLVGEEERVLGREHPLVFPARQLWSNTLAALGRYEQGVAVARETAERAQMQTNRSDERIALQRATLALHLQQAGQYGQAESEARSSLVYFEHQNDKQTSFVHRVIADSVLGQQRLDEARAQLAASVDSAQHIAGYARTAAWQDVLDSQSNLLRFAGDYVPALTLRSQACSRLNRSPGELTPPAKRCTAMLAWLRAAQCPGDNALRAAYDVAASNYVALLPADHLARWDAALLGSELDAAAGRSSSVDVSVARAAWQRTLGIAPPAHIIFLH